MSELKASTDVFFSAYLLSKGIKLAKYEVIDRGRVRCFFSLNDDEWKQFKVDFNNSEISDIKQHIAKIKDLCYVLLATFMFWGN